MERERERERVTGAPSMSRYKSQNLGRDSLDHGGLPVSQGHIPLLWPISLQGSVGTSVITSVSL